MLAELAPLEVQVRVLAAPAITVFGVAVNVTVKVVVGSPLGEPLGEGPGLGGGEGTTPRPPQPEKQSAAKKSSVTSEFLTIASPRPAADDYSSVNILE